MAHPGKPHLDRVPRRWKPSLWASKKPFGIGEQHPNNFAEITRAIRENRDQPVLPGAFIARGLRRLRARRGRIARLDHGRSHLCNIRLRLLRLNTMPALDPYVAGRCRRRSRSNERRAAGAWAPPLPDDPPTRVSPDSPASPGMRRSTRIAGRIRATTPDRIGFYLTSRGTPNETYYAAQKAVRAMGINSIDNAARICHSPSSHRVEADARRRRDHLLLQRLDRNRSARFHRRESGQQPAGHDQVPVLRQKGRHAGRLDQHLSRAGHGALLGAVGRRKAPSSARRSPTRRS